MRLIVLVSSFFVCASAFSMSLSGHKKGFKQVFEGIKGLDEVYRIVSSGMDHEAPKDFKAQYGDRPHANHRYLAHSGYELNIPRNDPSYAKAYQIPNLKRADVGKFLRNMYNQMTEQTLSLVFTEDNTTTRRGAKSLVAIIYDMHLIEDYTTPIRDPLQNSADIGTDLKKRLHKLLGPRDHIANDLAKNIDDAIRDVTSKKHISDDLRNIEFARRLHEIMGRSELGKRFEERWGRFLHPNVKRRNINADNHIKQVYEMDELFRRVGMEAYKQESLIPLNEIRKTSPKVVKSGTSDTNQKITAPESSKNSRCKQYLKNPRLFGYGVGAVSVAGLVVLQDCLRGEFGWHTAEKISGAVVIDIGMDASVELIDRGAEVATKNIAKNQTFRHLKKGVTSRIKRYAPKAFSKLAKKQGAKVSAKMGGRFAGVAFTVAVTAWDVYDTVCLYRSGNISFNHARVRIVGTTVTAGAVFYASSKVGATVGTFLGPGYGTVAGMIVGAFVGGVGAGGMIVYDYTVEKGKREFSMELEKSRSEWETIKIQSNYENHIRKLNTEYKSQSNGLWSIVNVE